jgi:hypothetical protein
VKWISTKDPLYSQKYTFVKDEEFDEYDFYPTLSDDVTSLRQSSFAFHMKDCLKRAAKAGLDAPQLEFFKKVLLDLHKSWKSKSERL